jgi:RNA-binding protein YlmH
MMDNVVASVSQISRHKIQSAIISKLVCVKNTIFFEKGLLVGVNEL